MQYTDSPAAMKGTELRLLLLSQIKKVCFKQLTYFLIVDGDYCTPLAGLLGLDCFAYKSYSLSFDLLSVCLSETFYKRFHARIP